MTQDKFTARDNGGDGVREANSQGAGVNMQSHAQDKSVAGAAGGTSAEKDAAGQFTQTKHGGHNNGVSSATPRVTTGTDDATFHHDRDK
jgi:hypothetical protein